MNERNAAISWDKNMNRCVCTKANGVPRLSVNNNKVSLMNVELNGKRMDNNAWGQKPVTPYNKNTTKKCDAICLPRKRSVAYVFVWFCLHYFTYAARFDCAKCFLFLCRTIGPTHFADFVMVLVFVIASSVWLQWFIFFLLQNVKCSVC